MIIVAYRVPDRLFAGMAVLVLLLSWITTIWIFPSLPERLPTHFGPSGLPDAFGEKSWGTVFVLPLLQAVISVVLWWLYRHPQFSNVPTSVPLQRLPSETRQQIFRILQHFLVVLATLVNLLLAQLNLAILAVGLGVATRLNNWLMGGILIALFGVIIFYIVILRRFIKASAPPLPPSVI